MKRHQAAAALAAILLLTACGGTDEDASEGASEAPADPATDDATDDEGTADEAPESPDSEAPPEGDPGAAAGDGAAGSDALLGPEVQVAIDDLVDRAGVAREDVLVTVTELVTWPDGSLGCPEPGTMYTQALVEGYRIVLEANGEPYAYHGASGAEATDPAYCADPQPPTE